MNCICHLASDLSRDGGSAVTQSPHPVDLDSDMRLVWAGVEGIGRFVEKASVDVDGRVVALVGANEAGKTTLLRAWEQISRRNESELTALVSQQISVSDNQEVVFARFALDESDRDAISHLYKGAQTRWLRVSIRRSGDLYYSFEPSLKRDPAANDRLRRDLKRAATNPILKEQADNDSAVFDFELVDSALAVFGDQSRKEQTFNELVSALDDLELEGAAQYVRDLSGSLVAAIERDREDPPQQQAWKILQDRVPVFRRFTQNDRGLRSRYSIDDDDFPDRALFNLFALAGVDPNDLIEVIDDRNYGVVATVQESGNAALASQLERWTQADLLVRMQFDVDSRVVGIFVQEHDGDEDGSFHPIERRSDGMLWFTALLAFLSREGALASSTILLIDEAETHLHYDAQADLVASMTRQTLADKVIYTTHSAGCLPEDMSRVRVVERSGTDSSIVENRYWRSGASGGVSPLIMRMGASRFAYTQSRLAVVTEGPSDFILWPTLLRECSDVSYLGFQMVPGLAEASDDELKALELEAGLVAYLVDNDKPGERLSKRLASLGIPPRRIVKVPYPMNTVEDAIDAGLLVRALNDNLRLSGYDEPFNDNSLKKRDRATQISDWLKSKDLPSLKKVDLAQRILDLATFEQITIASHDRQTAIKRLHDGVLAALGQVTLV